MAIQTRGRSSATAKKAGAVRKSAGKRAASAYKGE